MIGTLTRVRTKEPFCFAVQEDNTGDEIVDPKGRVGQADSTPRAVLLYSGES